MHGPHHRRGADMILTHLEAAGLTPQAASRAQAGKDETGEPLPVVISRLGLLSDDDVTRALGAAYTLDIVDEHDLPEVAIPTRVGLAFLKAHRALILSANERRVEIALVDPTDHEAVNGIAFATGADVNVRIIGFHLWRRVFDALHDIPSDPDSLDAHGRGARWTDDGGEIRDLALDAPAVRLAESLVADAVARRASDIHIERKPDGGLVRFRVDGRLSVVQRLSPGLADGLIARLKVLGDLDVADHRRAQDGRTTLSAKGRPIDVRLSIVPSAHGEGAVIRLLDRSDVRHDFLDLGFRKSEADRLRAATAKPQGLFLVSGPTGGGKTTTLYAAVEALRGEDRKIITIEDPIEYFFEDVHQTQLDAKAGLGFADALKAFLRHDPDIILVGEIRDPDTAKTAVQAALTGHLVLSTIHANDAASVPTRLAEMGVDPYLLAATLTATSAQRLVRRLCEHCKAPAPVPTELLDRAGLKSPAAPQFMTAVGCEHCADGYQGRMVITETLVFDDIANELVRENAGLEKLRGQIAEPLLVDGLVKAANGQTSIDEVLRALEAV
jgi:general secretion pathway protein E